MPPAGGDSFCHKTSRPHNRENTMTSTPTAATDSGSAETPSEWWPELGPKWKQSLVAKPSCVCVDVHAHLAVPDAEKLAKPFFKPELDPRSFFSSPESLRYNRELRSQPDQTAKFCDPEARLADMDLQGGGHAAAVGAPHRVLLLAVRSGGVQGFTPSARTPCRGGGTTPEPVRGGGQPAHGAPRPGGGGDDRDPA